MNDTNEADTPEALFSGWTDASDIHQMDGGSSATSLSCPDTIKEKTKEILVRHDPTLTLSTDADIVQALKQRMRLVNWMDYSIKTFAIVEDQSRHIDTIVQEEHSSLFDYAWLLSFVIAYGHDILHLPDEEQLQNVRIDNMVDWLNTNRDTNVLSIQTMMYDLFQKRLQTTYLEPFYKNRSSFVYDKSTKEYAPPHTNSADFTVPMFWPCSVPALSEATFLRYFFYNYEESGTRSPLRYFIIPFPLKKTVTLYPHDVSRSDAIEHFIHDIAHYAANEITAEKVESMRRMLSFLRQSFTNPGHKIIQEWAMTCFFFQIHETANAPFRYDGRKPMWSDVFTNFQIYEVGDNNLKLERMYLARQLVALANVYENSGCPPFNFLLETMAMSASANGYIPKEFKTKLFGNGKVYIYPATGLGFKKWGYFMPAIKCLIDKYSPIPNFEWDYPNEYDDIPDDDYNDDRSLDNPHKRQRITGGRRKYHSRRKSSKRPNMRKQGKSIRKNKRRRTRRMRHK